MNNFTAEKKIAVLGAGSWGTALAMLLAEKFVNVHLWGHSPEHIAILKKDRQNKKYLPDIVFPENLQLEHDLHKTVSDASLLVMVVPSHSLRKVFSNCIQSLDKSCTIVSAIKGIEVGSMQTMVEIMEEELRKLTDSISHSIECGVLSGPSFAKEVALKTPTAVTIGFKNIKTARDIQKIFNTDYFRVYASRDVAGLEITAALKNIIAIATGVCDGLGYGLNTRAALITRGLAEIARFGKYFNAEDTTFYGLSGMGDLILTCTGDLSRNRTVGLKLGQGKSLEQIKSEMKMVAEGIKTTKSVYELAKKLGIEMPILEQTYKVIYEGKDCSVAVKDLLTRELKEE